MDHEIFLSGCGTYVVLRLLGASGRNRLPQVVAAHELGARHGIRRYLVDLRDAESREAALDSYELAYHDFPANAAIDRHARVAALVAPGDNSHDFLITVFRNAGSHIEKFEDLASAEAYLKT